MCFLHISSEILKHYCQEIQAIPETFSLGLSESETIDDITSVVHFRFVEPTKINSFPLSGPAGSLACQWAVTIAVQGWAWPVNCCWQEENMLTATGTSQNTDLHFSSPSKETQSKAIFKTWGTHTLWDAWGRAYPLVLYHKCQRACPTSSCQPSPVETILWSLSLLVRGPVPARLFPKHHLLSHVVPRVRVGGRNSDFTTTNSDVIIRIKYIKI